MSKNLAIRLFVYVVLNFLIGVNTVAANTAERFHSCATLQIYYMHFHQPNKKLTKVINLAKQVNFQKDKLRSQYLEMIETVQNDLYGKSVFTCTKSNGLMDFECLDKQFEYRVQKLKSDPLWKYHKCKIVVASSKPSYDDLIDQVEDLQDRIDQLENK